MKNVPASEKADLTVRSWMWSVLAFQQQCWIESRLRLCCASYVPRRKRHGK